ncbi:MAG: pyrroloquinoline quinone biosynthesis protein PqqB [Flavobacteriaceae bacterium]|nr:pyrroloquinoline quinone biosynthesis protein PqqB [Flavobacteriaceae bacterium]|tara:strand:+ start:89673 stop:90611 length:939 start_codon:yes stop_codon:yes gene_type:complete
MKKEILFVLLFGFFNCSKSETSKAISAPQYLTVLGIAQDGGSPHIGCQKDCCQSIYNGLSKRKSVVSLGLVDTDRQQKWLFEATPDIATQLADLEEHHLKNESIIDGIFLTHAHIGHYTGLMYFGREALGKQGTKVFAMPKMKQFLETNGPWSQLVNLKNIELSPLKKDSAIQLNSSLRVIPFQVPHRDEYSETVGYKIIGPNKSALFIPDIDKWEKWDKNIVEEVKQVDYAFVDATFFDANEVKRPISEIPHPFISETVSLFENESLATKSKVVFIHFNHTNPAIKKESKARKTIEALGFQFASEGDQYDL